MTIEVKHTHEILDFTCLSSKHRAYIPGVISGSCQCGNCKVRVRNHREHPGAFDGDTSYHDYVQDVEEVQHLAEQGLIVRKKSYKPLTKTRNEQNRI